jgi:branched-chain amino acid transport system permease protein
LWKNKADGFPTCRGNCGAGLKLLYSLEPYAHNLWLIFLFLVVVGNMLGTGAAGLIIGLISGLSSVFLPYQWANLTYLRVSFDNSFC